MLKLGNVYFFNNLRAQLSSSALKHSLTNYNLCNEYNFEGLSFSKKVLLDSVPSVELSPVVVEVEHAISNLLILSQGRSKKLVREILEIDELIKDFFFSRAIPACSNEKCAHYEKELIPNSQERLINELSPQVIPSDIVFISYGVSGSFEKLVWEFREAVSQGVKRFLIDGEYYQHEEERQPKKGDLSAALSFTEQETLLFKSAKRLDVFERTISISQGEDLEPRLTELLKIEKSSTSRHYFLGILRKEKARFDVIKNTPIGGTHFCSTCNTAYDTSDKSSLPSPRFMLGRYTLSEVKELGFDDLKNICLFEPDENPESLNLIFLCDSHLHTKAEKTFQDLSHYEQILCYLLACKFKEVRNQFFIFSPLAAPAERDPILLEIITIVKELQNLNNSFIFGNALYHTAPLFKDAAHLNERFEISPETLPSQEPLDALSSYTVPQLEIAEISPGLIHVQGAAASGKTALIKGILSLPLIKRGGKMKGKHEWVYLGYRDNQFIAESNLKSHPCLVLQTQEAPVYNVLAVEEQIAELYASTRNAQSHNLYFQDFLSPQKSNHRCKFCDGTGAIKNKLLFGYEVHGMCSVCEGTGCDSVYNEVSFLNYGFRDLLNLDLGSFFEAFVINNDFEKAQKVLNQLLKYDLDLRNIKLKAKIYELEEHDRLSFALFVILLNCKGGQSYAFEHIFDNFLNKRSNISAYLNEYFKEKGGLLLSCIYR